MVEQAAGGGCRRWPVVAGGELGGGATVTPAAVRWRQRRRLGSGNDAVNDAMALSNRSEA
ncbi:hypothetical protein Syun_010356 [Stephania yunnanensis]|uniref:Uncharacterized protein n=1 Tax=Stephania yunnanensis TaxID=152371 RepID=A0AAP0PPX0_9MAGN